MLKPEEHSGPEAAPIDHSRREGRGAESNRRRRTRRRVLLKAILELPEGERTVSLRNLSGAGALIEMDRPPPIGTLVTFCRGNTLAPATVKWVDESMVGIEFIRPIDEAEVLVHIRRPFAIF